MSLNREQLKTILWLRWRLTRNQWQRTGGLGAVLAVFIGAGAVTLGAAAFAAGLLGGALGLGEAKPELVMFLWLGVTVGFLFFWLIGLMSELQRSETIDLQRLMHLPVALGQMFLINYVTSLATISIVIAGPGLTGLALGLAISRGPLLLLLLPLAWAMIFMVSAWTYCLRGWLAAMMNNPRRRRAIIMGITVAFILAAQLPNLYFNVLGGRHRHKASSGEPTPAAKPDAAALAAGHQATLDRLILAQQILPPLWVSYGAFTLAEHRVVPALLGTIGCLGLGALGLRRAYRTTLNFYQGVSGRRRRSSAQVTAPAAPAGPPARTLLDLRLPAVVPEPAAAVACGTFRSMLRAPEVKLAWGTSFLVTLFVGASVLFRSSTKIPEPARPFVVTGVLAFSLFMQVQFFANQFGFDRQGFRAFVLSPVERRFILLGKNLATWPVGGLFGLILLVALSLWLRLPVLTALAGGLQLVTLLLMASLGGNLLSICVPFKVQAGSLKSTKMPALPTLVMVLCHMLFPLTMTPVFAPVLLELIWRSAGWPALVPVNLIGSAVLAAVVGLVYVQSLGAYGRLLQRREIKILNTVTADQE